MAVLMLVNYHHQQPLAIAVQSQSQNPSFNSRKIHLNQSNTSNPRRRRITNCLHGDSDSDPNSPQDKEVNNLGVKAALSILKFYKREISPLMPKSCRYVPTCSEIWGCKRYSLDCLASLSLQSPWWFWI